jgi:hypothetical protein
MLMLALTISCFAAFNSMLTYIIKKAHGAEQERQ